MIDDVLVRDHSVVESNELPFFDIRVKLPKASFGIVVSATMGIAAALADRDNCPRRVLRRLLVAHELEEKRSEGG